MDDEKSLILSEPEPMIDQDQVKSSVAAADAQIDELQRLVAGKYQILRRLGKGAQGSVFLAVSLETQQKVAIKQLRIQSVKDWKRYDLFHREADTLQRLNISGVARLHETLEMLDIDSPMALIVQDYLEGDPMQTFISKGHRFQLQQIGQILMQLIDILKKLHHSDPIVIHRDIKPSNIILNYKEDGSIGVHLIDFGAVSNPQVKGGGSTVVGTYGYMAPEQLMGNASPASDIYSLAIVAVYLLSGVPPEQLEVKDYHVLIDSHLEHLPYAITAFLRAMLEPRSDNRMCDYTQIRSFAEAITKQAFNLIPVDNDENDRKRSFDINTVYSFHQTGNIDIWQALPDKTPRKYSKEYLSRHHWEKMMSIKVMKKSDAPFILCFCFICAFVVSFAIYNDMIDVDGFWFLSFRGALIGTPIIFIAFLISGLCGFYHSKESKFFKNARKSMATVIRVRYHQIYNRGFDEKYIANKLKSYQPVWTITYSFNPPDDASADNLIHSFDTNTLPDIKEGDIIPILYQIENAGMKNEKVYSMPWPLPVYDMLKVGGSK